jgi:type I restriction enzyme R subunit
MHAYRDRFRKIGLTFEEKAFYDILMALRDEYNFEYGTDKIIDGVSVNDKCKVLAKRIKEIIDTKSSFADWLNNQYVRNQLKFDIKVCLVKNGYPPQYSPEVFRKVMEQAENFKKYED